MSADVFHFTDIALRCNPNAELHGSVQGKFGGDRGIFRVVMLKDFALTGNSPTETGQQKKRRDQDGLRSIQKFSLKAIWMILGSRARLTWPKVGPSLMLPLGLRN